jgi:Zn-dependent protease with chaperone function/Flp pilus assembly protein TadD
MKLERWDLEVVVKKINKIGLKYCLLLVVITSSLTGCKSTIHGAMDAVTNLVGDGIHNDFEGRFISQANVAEYKKREDGLSGDSRVISYSGLNIPAEQVRGAHVVHSPVMKDYLASILDNILAQWDGTSVNIQIQVVHTQNFAPYADAYGMISIPIGALSNVESEDELALLIAHEASHILMRHHERQTVVDENKAGVEMFAKAVILANVAKDTKFGKKNGGKLLNYEPSAQGDKNISKAMVYNAVIQTISDSVWNTAWQRTQEEEADLLGFDLAMSAGYSPRANPHVLQRLADFQGKQQGMLSVFWAQKKEAVTAAFQSGNLKNLDGQLNSFLVEGLQTSVAAATDYLQKRHMTPEAREQSMREYAIRVYRPEIGRRINTQKWAAMLTNPEVKEVISSYRMAFEASNALAANDIQQAEILALKSLTPSVKNHPYMREVMFNVRTAQGNPVRANQNLALIGRWQDASPSLYELKITQHFNENNFEQALVTIDMAEKTFGNESKFIIEKSIAQANLGLLEEAKQTLEKCKSYSEVKSHCEVLLEQIG